MLLFLSPESVWTKSYGLTNEMKATEYFSRVVLFFCIIHAWCFFFEPVDKILKCNHSMKATQQYFPVVLFIGLCKVVLTFESVDKSKTQTINRAIPYFSVVLIIFP